ncbi:hypothetical protein D623_10035385 [Myotis brandtii]|uniref:Uncharacterized protein n=1 Tax=Myotis brandtii TaxID=109478 RepID=S7MMT5_MYOBR|nr:hypothetical protein D623_10035385 [Myotis brandtii]
MQPRSDLYNNHHHPLKALSRFLTPAGTKTNSLPTAKEALQNARPAASFSSFLCYLSSLGRNLIALSEPVFSRLGSYLGSGFSLKQNENYTYCVLAHRLVHNTKKSSSSGCRRRGEDGHRARGHS